MAELYYLGERDSPIEIGQTLALDKDESHHLLRVCRVAIGSTVDVFGNSRKYEAELVDVRGKIAVLRVTGDLTSEVVQLKKAKLVLAIPFLKGGRTEYLMEKLTELGVDGMILYSSSRSVIRVGPDKRSRYMGVVLNACKQCERLDLPEITIASDLEEAMARLTASDNIRIYLAIERRDNILSLSQALESHTQTEPFPTIGFISGPEGGFTQDEQKLLMRLGIPVHLGPRILRADTAPLVMATVALSKTGEM